MRGCAAARFIAAGLALAAVTLVAPLTAPTPRAGAVAASRRPAAARPFLAGPARPAPARPAGARRAGGGGCVADPQNRLVTNRSVDFGFARYGVSTGEIRQTSPTVADVEVGGMLETIVVFGDESGMVHVIDAATCQELPGWPREMARPPGVASGEHAVIESTPAVGWLDGPRRPPTIVVGAGSTWQHSDVGEVEAFRLDGSERWLRVVRATPGNNVGVFSSPAIGDVGGGGQQDVVFGSWDYHLYVLNADGRSLPGTPFYNAETIWSSPALFQMPGQRADDVFIGLDKTQTDKPGGCVGGFVADLRYGLVPGTHRRGLYVVHESGCQGRSPGSRHGQAVWSSPAVGYLSPPALAPQLALAGASSRHTTAPPGATSDPVVAIGTSWYDQPFGYGTNRLYVYNATTMHLLWSGITRGPVYGSPAIGMLAGHGSAPAVVDTSFVCAQPIALDHLSNCLSTGVSDVDAWSATGSLLWHQQLIGPTDLGSPVLVPLLGEVGNDVLVGSGDGLYPLRGADGAYLYGTSALGPQRAIHPGCRLFNTPAVADVVGSGPFTGWYAFELCSDGASTSGGLYAFPLPRPPGAAPAWPMFRADPTHTGVAFTTLAGDPVPAGLPVPARSESSSGARATDRSARRG